VNRFIYEREMLSPDEGGGASVERNIGETVDSNNAGGAAGAVLSSSGEVLVGLSAAEVRAEVEAGLVISQDIAAGETVPAGSAITIIVSRSGMEDAGGEDNGNEAEGRTRSSMR